MNEEDSLTDKNKDEGEPSMQMASILSDEGLVVAVIPAEVTLAELDEILPKHKPSEENTSDKQ